MHPRTAQTIRLTLFAILVVCAIVIATVLTTRIAPSDQPSRAAVAAPIVSGTYACTVVVGDNLDVHCPLTSTTPSPSPSTTGTPSPSPTVTATPTPTATATPTPTATPSSTPTPTPTSGTCPVAGTNVAGGTDTQNGGCWPGPGNTGVPAGSTLTVRSGDLTISTDNTVVSNMDIRGCVTVNANGVTIKNSHIHATCASDVIGHFVPKHDGNPVPAGASPLTIVDSEIDCNNGPGTAVGDTNISLLRVNIHGCENGGDVDGAYTVRDSWVHNLWAASTSHTDGFQITEVGHNIAFVHNWDDPLTDATSAIITSPFATNVLVQNNILGGGAYSLYCTINTATPSFQALGNRFLRDYAFGPWTDCSDDTTSGNVWNDTGLPVPPG